MELEAALAEAEGALEQEENKVLRLSLELNEVRHQIDMRIAQKELEFESSRKNFTKALDGLQVSLENESKGKNEALRQKKKLETDVVDLGVSLEHANAAMQESQRNIGRMQQNIREVQTKIEQESRARATAPCPCRPLPGGAPGYCISGRSAVAAAPVYPSLSSGQWHGGAW